MTTQSLIGGEKALLICVKELKDIHKAETGWRSVLAGFQSNSKTFQTSFNFFKSLPLNLQERILNKLDWSQIRMESLEMMLLNYLMSQSDWQNLRFRNAQVLTDGSLETILQKSRQLQGLSIVNCELITPKSIKFLPWRTNLDQIFLSDMKWTNIAFASVNKSPNPFWRFQIPYFPVLDLNQSLSSLRVLVLKNFPNLQSLDIPRLGLESLHISNCPLLRPVLLKNTSSLQGLKFLDCPYLEIPWFSEFFGNCMYKKEAFRWYSLAAEQKNAHAQLNLGVMYDTGAGVKMDKKKAAKWYTLAANQGNATAQSKLGVMHEKGEGLTMDKTKAAKWYTLAAEQGNAINCTNEIGGDVQQR
jgi:hypothetical protein